MTFDTPVALLIFNRPDLTARTFAAIATVRPKRLFVVADGPRESRPEEAELVRETRRIVDQIDWPCELLTNFSDTNLGCKRRITGGLEWVFKNTEEAIILEDDCLPDPTFFSFCRALLDRYRDDHRIATISGSNFQGGRSRTAYSYYFSKYFHCVGWASWRRTWETFDVSLADWPVFSSKGRMRAIADSLDEHLYWTNIFDRQYLGQLDSWAYPWLYACWVGNGLTVIPDVNLVTNIGFDTRATHSSDKMSPIANVPLGKLTRLDHPPTVERNREADTFTFQDIFLGKRRRGLRRMSWILRYLVKIQWRRLPVRLPPFAALIQAQR